MEVTINARHCTVPDSLRNQATQRVTRLQRLHHRLTGGTIVFEVERELRRAEARLAVAGGPPLISHGEGATLRVAMDSALDRLERQLKRRRERNLTRRGRAARGIAAS